MVITISTSGGFGGFGLAKKTQVAVESLPEPLRVEACARLDPGALGALDPAPARGAADRIVYHVVVEEGGERASFDLPETALPDATLELIDSLFDLRR